MLHINWRRQSGHELNPFQEIEIEMSGFRDSARNAGFYQDGDIMSFDNEINNLVNNSQNLMSLLPVRPSVNQAVNRNTGYENRNSRRYPQNSELEVSQNNYSLEPIHNQHVNESENNQVRRRRPRNYVDLNNHVFPAPRHDRQVWYDPNDPSIDNRLPQIPKRVLTLSEINRIPTKKVKDCGNSCDICLDDLKKGENTKILNCKHYYHTSCVDPWLKQHPTCPKCRRQVRAPPENKKRVPRPVPPPCPVRERGRAYDRERRTRLQNGTSLGQSNQNNTNENNQSIALTAVEHNEAVEQNTADMQSATDDQNAAVGRNVAMEQSLAGNIAVSPELPTPGQNTPEDLTPSRRSPGIQLPEIANVSSP